MDDDQQFCLRWNNHQSTLVSVFDTLLEKGMHVDCTLAAEGQTLKAHKVVLSACSPYFESVLSQQYDKHPIIILKDVKYAELRAMMDYMYRGEVNISQDQLAALLKAAESLQIKGLSDNKPTRPPSRPQPQTVPPQSIAHAPQHATHPPRAHSPQPKTRDGSIDSREGSVSPTRRRKKARRASNDTTATNLPPNSDSAQGNGDELPQCKEESHRDGVEDLTLDEEPDDQPPVTHNDVVRNFQWHMERSQDEIMNSSDSVRESQGKKPAPRHTITTRSKNNATEETAGGNVTTLAILKNVKSPKLATDDSKENKRGQDKQPDTAGQAVSTPTAGQGPQTAAVAQPAQTATGDAESRYNIFPKGEKVNDLLPPYKKDKVHKCPNCQRSYNARKNLVRHVTLECGREPQYKCPHCTYSRHRRNELKKHIEKKHPDRHQSALAVK